MQNDPALPITQDGMKPVIDLGNGALQREVERNRLRQSEQQQNLVEQMRTEVVPEAAARHGLFAPAGTHVGAIAIEV